MSKILATIISLAVLALVVPILSNAARTDGAWNDRIGLYLEVVWPEGRNILIRGINKYINFGTLSGTSGYGIRDNNGTIECKDSGGSWSPCQDGNGATGSYPDYLSQVGDVSTTSLDTYDLLWYDGVNWSPVATTSLGITAGSGVTDHGLLTGLLDNDHPQYFLLSDWYSTTTSDLAEGTNLYYTDARVGTYISGSSTVPHVGGTANGDILKWTGSAWTTMATSGIGYLWGNLGNIPAGFADGVDDTGDTLSGGSTNVLTYWTSGSTVGATSSPTVGYITATTTTASRLPFASSTGITATNFWGSLIGNVTGNVSGTAGSLASNGGNCTAGNFPLGVDASGAVETCTDAWTEAENTSAAYINSSALTPYLTLSAFYSTTTSDIGEGTNLYYTDARVNSYVHGSTTVPKTYTANTFTGLQTINNASTTHLSITGNSYLGTVRSGTWNGGSIADAYVDDTITASNYVLTSAYNGLFDTRLSATTSLPQIGTLAGLMTIGSSTGTTTTAGGMKLSLLDCSGLSNSGKLTVNAAHEVVCSADVSGGVGGSPVGTDGQVQYNDGGAFGGASALFYDDGSNRVGIGTTTPAELLHLYQPTGGFTTSRWDSGITKGYMYAYDGDNSFNLGALSDSYFYFKQNNANTGYINTDGQWTIQNPAGNSTIFSVKAPSGTQEESTITTMLEHSAGNSEFIDWTLEDYGTDFQGSINVAKDGTGTLVPFSLRFWDSDLGPIDTYGQYSQTWLPSGKVGFGVSTSTLGATSYAFLVGSTTAISAFYATATAPVFVATSTASTSTMPRLAATTAFTLIGDYITNVATWFDARVELLSNVVVAAASVWDFGGAASLEIPNGTGPTADDPGEIAHDTTDNQLLVDDYVMGRAVGKIWSTTVASTSPAFISGGLLPVPTDIDGYTITRIQCHVTGGTSKVVALEDASANSSEDITCATTNTTDDGSITNATYTASELSYIDFGATSGSVNYVTVSVFGTLTRE